MLKRSLTGAVILLITVAFVLLKMVSPLFFDAFVLIIAVIVFIRHSYSNRAVFTRSCLIEAENISETILDTTASSVI